METELHDAVKVQKLHEGAEVLEAKGEENVLLDVAKLPELRGREEALEAQTCALEEEDL